ncbi:hypothetical protein LINPERHAP2_LOCUS7667, partial [Linum perenne]
QTDILTGNILSVISSRVSQRDNSNSNSIVWTIKHETNHFTKRCPKETCNQLQE